MNKIIKKYLLLNNLIIAYNKTINNVYINIPFIVYKYYLKYSLEYISLLCRYSDFNITYFNGSLYNLSNYWCLTIYLNDFILIDLDIEEHTHIKIHRLIDRFNGCDITYNNVKLIKNNYILSVLNLYDNIL